MAKKKKAGKKGQARKHAKKKDELLHLDRQIYLLKIKELENKITWRKRIISRTDDGAELHKSAYDEEHAKSNTISLLEVAIKEQIAINDGYSDAISNVVGEMEGSDLGSMAHGYRRLDELRSAYDAELDVLRREVHILESFDPTKLKYKLDELKKQVESYDVQSSILNSVELDRRREKYLREVLPQILEEEAMIFQKETKNRMPVMFQRVAEETRWRKVCLTDLLQISEKLDAKNEGLEDRLKSAKDTMKAGKEAALQASAYLQTRRLQKLDLVRQDHQRQYRRKVADGLRTKTELQDKVGDDLYSRLYDARKRQKQHVEKLKDHEDLILKREEMLSDEKQLNRFLWEIVRQSQSWIEEEVLHTLIISFDDRRLAKNLLLDLEALLDRAAKAIYDLKDKDTVVAKDTQEHIIEYDEMGSYEKGSLGLLPAGDQDEESTSWESDDDSAPRGIALPRDSPFDSCKDREFDQTSAKILSDLGLVSKFKRKVGNRYVLRKYRVKR